MVFARAPVAGHAKTRLIPALGPEGAAYFQAALVSDTLRKVARLSRRIQPYLFVAGEDARHGGQVEPNLLKRSVVRAGGREFKIIYQQGSGLGERLENAFRVLFRLHPSVVVIGTDSPLLPPFVLGAAVRELNACESVLGPCPDGGFYLLGLRRLRGPAGLPGVFRRVRWSSAFAFSDTLRNVLRLGLSCSVLEAYADADLPADLRRLKASLEHNERSRRLAPATWKFLSTNSIT